jgi:hypothetical protein
MLSLNLNKRTIVNARTSKWTMYAGRVSSVDDWTIFINEVDAARSKIVECGKCWFHFDGVTTH